MRSTAAAAWAKQAGLDTSGKAAWSIEITLNTTGKRPTSTGSPRQTYFYLEINAEQWNLRVNHAGKYFGYVQLGSDKPEGVGSLKVPPRPTLAALGPWLAKTEKMHEIEFRRDVPLVKSSIKGGTSVAEAWIAKL